MTEAFYITMHKGVQAAVDALGVNLVIQGAPKFDPEQPVTVLKAISFYQVERVASERTRFERLSPKERQKALQFSVAPFYSLEYNLAPTRRS